MTDLEFIKLYSKISITKICKENNVNQSNLWAGKSKAEKIKTVKDSIIKEMLDLLVKYVENQE